MAPGSSSIEAIKVSVDRSVDLSTMSLLCYSTTRGVTLLCLDGCNVVMIGSVWLRFYRFERRGRRSMGYIQHRAILVTASREEQAREAHQKASAICGELVSPLHGPVTN